MVNYIQSQGENNMATFNMWKLCPNEEFISCSEWPIYDILEYYDLEDKFIQYWKKEFGLDSGVTIEEIIEYNNRFDQLDPEDLLIPIFDMLPGTFAIYFDESDDYTYLMKIYQINDTELLDLFKQVFKVKYSGATLESIEVALNV